MNRCTRRRTLALGSATLLQATAGCASINPFSGDSDDGPPDFRASLPAAELGAADRPTVTYEAVDSLLDELPPGHRRIQEIQNSLDQWIVPVNRLDGRLDVDAGELLGTVFLGSFDDDAVLEQMDPPEENPETDGEFTLVGPTRAVGPGVIVLSSSPRTFVDAYRGDVERAHEASSRWERVLDSSADADLLRVIAPEVAPFEVLGLAVDVVDETGFQGTATAQFVAEADASAHENVVEPYVREMVSEDVTTQIEGTSRDGAVVEVDAAWSSIPF